MKLGGIVDLIPTFLPSVAHQSATKGQDVLSSHLRPEHPRLFESLAYDGATSGFHYSGSIEKALFSKRAVHHLLLVIVQVADLFLNFP